MFAGGSPREAGVRGFGRLREAFLNGEFSRDPEVYLLGDACLIAETTPTAATPRYVVSPQTAGVRTESQTLQRVMASLAEETSHGTVAPHDEKSRQDAISYQGGISSFARVDETTLERFLGRRPSDASALVAGMGLESLPGRACAALCPVGSSAPSSVLSPVSVPAAAPPSFLLQ
jgi:hypothetical protein